MNKQFKERLTGAVILVLFVVIVVPALLSGPPRPAAPLTSVRGEASAGSEGAPLRSYTIDLTDPAGTQPPVTPMEQQDAAPPPPSPPQAPAQAPATAPAVPPPAQAGPVPQAAPAAAPNGLATPASIGAGFAVQIGSFANRANAEGLVATLRKGGFPAFISPTGGARTLYRVRVGPVADRAEAQVLATSLAAAGQAGKVVSHP